MLMSKYVCITPNCAIALSKAVFPTLRNCPVCQQSLIEFSENAVISDLDENLISGLPYVIAYPLKRTLLEKHAWTKINLFKDTFQNYLKYLGLIAASEFFNSSLKDKKMVALFHQTLAQPSFGSWNQYIRETLNYLKENHHNFFCPDILAYYEFVETGKKRKLFKGEIEFIDSNGDVQIKKQEATAIGMLINFRNRYLGHGLTLDEGASQKLWDEYYPIFKDLLEKLTLTIHFPMFKHEHGESYLLSAAEISPIEKGLQTPSRVWIENKEGESMDILPFFVVPGEVSIGKEDKEQILTYESYTGKTIKFFSPEGTEKQTSGKILEKLNLLLREKQKEQPYSPDSFTKEVFLNRIADENKHILDTLISEKKVIPGVYVNREEMEIKLREWIGARANIFFIAAEAGSGKTNLLVEIQRQYLERNLSSLLIRACRMEKQSLKEQIAYLLNLDSSLGLNNYSAVSGTQAEPTFILIDGLNEASNAEEIWKEVLELSQIFVAGSLKFVITSRANSKVDIERYTLTKEGEIFIYGENKERENGLAAFVYWLTPLNMMEMKTAWEDYMKKDKNKFKPLFTFDDLATFDRSLYNQISNPLVLRLFLETYHGKKLPEKGNQHLNIWKDWFRAFSIEEQNFMKLLAAEIWGKGENELLLDDLLKHETLKSYFTSDVINAPYHRLKNLGWISRYVKDLNSYVSLTVEGALLYLLAQELYFRNSQFEDIRDVLENDNKLKRSAVEVFLSQKAIEGDLVFVRELIDSCTDYIELCINPLIFYLKSFGVKRTLENIFTNPTGSDWEIIYSLARELYHLDLLKYRKDLLLRSMIYNQLNNAQAILVGIKCIEYYEKDKSELILSKLKKQNKLLDLDPKLYLTIVSKGMKIWEYKECIFLINRFLQKSCPQSSKCEKKMIDALIMKGEVQNHFKHHRKAIDSLFKSLTLAEVINYRLDDIYFYIGNTYENLECYESAIEYFKKDLNYHIQNNNLDKIHFAYSSIGVIYMMQSNYQEASENFLLALENSIRIFGELHSETALYYDYLALICEIFNMNDLALKFYLKIATIKHYTGVINEELKSKIIDLRKELGKEDELPEWMK
jgi:hypothetical protein